MLGAQLRLVETFIILLIKAFFFLGTWSGVCVAMWLQVFTSFFFFWQVLGIQSCALYIAEKEAWLTRMGYFTVEHCKMLLPNHPLSDPALNYCRSVKSIVKNDVTLYALLHCVVLFDPCDERVIDRQLINSIRDKYIILLRHYLESVYSYRHSEKYMMALQENLIFYRNLCQEGKPLVKKFFPSIPNKLLVEVMDLEWEKGFGWEGEWIGGERGIAWVEFT